MRKGCGLFLWPFSVAFQFCSPLYCSVLSGVLTGCPDENENHSRKTQNRFASFVMIGKLSGHLMILPELKCQADSATSLTICLLSPLTPIPGWEGRVAMDLDQRKRNFSVSRRKLRAFYCCQPLAQGGPCPPPSTSPPLTEEPR